MTGADETRFGVDEDAVFGDLAGALYALFGGDCAAKEDACAFLIENGMVPPESTADEVLTSESVHQIITGFCEAIGMQYPGEAPAEPDAVLTRGQLSEILMTFVSGLE